MLLSRKIGRRVATGYTGSWRTLDVEVIKLNQIFYLLMTLDATHCDVQRIYGLAEYPKVESQSEYDNLKHWTA